MNIAVIILTYNEQLHIERCIDSAKKITDEIYVIDSFSDDNTLSIANYKNVTILKNKFINNGIQFQWAINNCNVKADWIMKLDADEIITDELANEINNLHYIDNSINGFKINLNVIFLDKLISHGGYPILIPRIIRKNYGIMSDSYMDEHFSLLTGSWGVLNFHLVDNNLNSLSWWINKHNNYSTREALMRLINIDSNSFKLNKKIYLFFPPILRPLLYFIYRYFFKLGFLDGIAGFYWHFLQGFWYQLLIDVKMYQINNKYKRTNLTYKEIFDLEIKINNK